MCVVWRPLFNGIRYVFTIESIHLILTSAILTMISVLYMVNACSSLGHSNYSLNYSPSLVISDCCITEFFQILYLATILYIQ